MPDELNPAFKALSDPTRRRILKLLREKRMNAGEIAGHFDISKASISHHLKSLRSAGLVGSERDGQHVIYALKTTVLQEVAGWFFEMMEPSESVESSNLEPEGSHE